MNWQALIRAYRLFRSDSKAETVAALVLVGLVAGPVLLAHMKNRRGGDGLRP